MSTPPPIPPQQPPQQPPPGYYPPPGMQPQKSNVGLIVGIVIACVVIFGACGVSILLPALSKARETANRVKCMTNLRQIGTAMMLYANENNGAYPDTIGGLMDQPITTAVLVCPSSTDTPALPGATPKATGANVEAGGHLSYVYLGKGLTNRAQADLVLVYEPMANHHNSGMSVLYGDGHVEFLNAQNAGAVMAELNAGHNPPRIKASLLNQ
jgi:prepilin-type processing-associated H-X9-DG protein